MIGYFEKGIREMKLRLRQYKPCDADRIISWIKDAEALRKLSESSLLQLNAAKTLAKTLKGDLRK